MCHNVNLSLRLPKNLVRSAIALLAVSLGWLFLWVPFSCGCSYTPRAQVTDGLNFASAAKTAVAETFLRAGRMPRDRAEAGLPQDPIGLQGKYVSSLDVEGGRIDITYGNEADSEITNRVLSLTPYVVVSHDGADSIVWRCGYAGIPEEGIALAAYRSGDLAIEHLPATCRQ
jgi:type IV pilus assembly protein PilA